jgi:hypothetical protein
VNITIRPELENKIRERAETEGISVEAYLERLVQADNRQLKNWKLWLSKGSIPAFP